MSLELSNKAATTPPARAADVLPAPSSASEPRFDGDWVDAMLYLGHGTVRITGCDVDRILLVDDFEALRRAVPHGSPAMVQFNPALGRVLVPGGHARAGRSFFTLSPAP